MKRICCKMIGLLLSGIFCGALLLCLVYLLPLEPIQQHVKESMNTITKEGENPFLLKGYKGSSLDNFTDSIMLANASYRSEHAFYRAAMLVERTDNGQMQPIESLYGYIMKSERQEIIAYSRYWHGYLVILKPLLLFLNYDQIRMLNGVLFFGVLSGMAAGFMKRKMWRGIIAFLFAVCSLFPMTIPYSLQYSSMFYIGILACLSIVWGYEYLEKKKAFIYFFLCIGMLTSFFDFLTYPLFTLGMPMILICVLDNSANAQKIWNVIKYSIFWGIGYIGMWCGKWVVGSVLTKSNLFADAFITVAYRLSNDASGKEINMVLAVLRNGYIYFNFIGIVLGLLLCIWIWFGSRKCKKSIPGKYQQLSALFMTMIMPITWYCVVVNHSYVHYWYTFRSLAVSVFALGMIPEVICMGQEN